MSTQMEPLSVQSATFTQKSMSMPSSVEEMLLFKDRNTVGLGERVAALGRVSGDVDVDAPICDVGDRHPVEFVASMSQAAIAMPRPSMFWIVETQGE